MDIEFVDNCETFSPVMKRYIALMVAFVCINITIIYEDLKLKGTDRQPVFAFKIFFIVFNLIILFFYSLNYSVTLVFKYTTIKSQIKRFLTLVGIAAALMLFFAFPIIAFFVFRPDWVRTLYASVQCFQLVFIQLFVIVDTLLINWKPDFFLE